MPKKILGSNIVNPKKLYKIAFGKGNFTERLWKILNYVKSVKKKPNSGKGEDNTQNH